jgi:predicted ArsR family transcriptional regulator
MFLRSLRDIAKPQSVAVIGLLKRSTGMSVAEMARELKMSYMGVKQHCVDLEKKGFLDTWRRPKTIGRPEKTYRLTEKARDLFPDAGCEVTLDLLKDVQSIYGPNAPDKLLFSFFSKRTDYYLKKVKGDTPTQRAFSFSKLREVDGYVSEVSLEGEDGFAIVEYHNPLERITAKYPSAVRMEESMFSRIIGASVTRSEERASALSRFVFGIEGKPDIPEKAAEELTAPAPSMVAHAGIALG